MRIGEDPRLVRPPSYTAVEALLQNGLPVQPERAAAQMAREQKDLVTLERSMEGEAATRGVGRMGRGARGGRSRPAGVHAPSPRDVRHIGKSGSLLGERGVEDARHQGC